MNWQAWYSDRGGPVDAGPGEPIDTDHLIYIECEGHGVVVSPGCRFHRLERTSIGKESWRVGIIAVDEDITIVYEGGGTVRRQVGWGSDVMTAAPVGA